MAKKRAYHRGADVQDLLRNLQDGAEQKTVKHWWDIGWLVEHGEIMVKLWLKYGWIWLNMNIAEMMVKYRLNMNIKFEWWL